MLVAWESANGVVRLSCYSPAMFRRMDALAILEVAKLDVMGVMVE